VEARATASSGRLRHVCGVRTGAGGRARATDGARRGGDAELRTERTGSGRVRSGWLLQLFRFVAFMDCTCGPGAPL
jgi:hypothetical protein